MLDELRIHRLGVIEHAELRLGGGLTVLTGETGAGKTMVLSALDLLLGGRADPGAIRADSDVAEVEGVVRVDGLDAVVARAVQAGAAVDEGRLVIARTVAAQGRSRALLGGRTVPSTVLAELADDLVAVHGQSSQVALVRPERQRRLLDTYAGPAGAAALEQVAGIHRRLVEVEDELGAIGTQARERAREADQLRYGLDEIAAVAPEPGEEHRLAEEEARLAHVDRLRESVGSALMMLAGDDVEASGTDALSQLAAARRALDSARGLDPSLADAADKLAEATYALVDVAGDLSGYLGDLDVDPARLAVVADRRAALAHLFRRYGEDVPAVLAWAERAAARLALLDDDEGRLAALARERRDLRESLGRAAGALSAIRREAADRLATAVTAELHALAMPTATLTIAVDQRDDPDGILVDRFPGRRLVCAASGVDHVTFGLSAYEGAPARLLGRGASGGELSRTMLALEVVLSSADPVPTLVFDEVDAGVGGRAAVEVGRRLARLGRHAQVIVVTHLPQVAAFADCHYVVHRDTDGQVTSSGVHRVQDTERAAELARMMAGLQASDAALRHAEELLETAHTERQRVA